MLIRTTNSLYDTDKVRSFEVYADNSKYDAFDAHLGIVYGFLEREGCNDGPYIFSGTVGECQAMLTRIANAIVQGEIKIFTIKDDGTRREKSGEPDKEMAKELFGENEEEIEIPF